MQAGLWLVVSTEIQFNSIWFDNMQPKVDIHEIEMCNNISYPYSITRGKIDNSTMCVISVQTVHIVTALLLLDFLQYYWNIFKIVFPM